MESTPSDYLFSPNNFIKRTCETPLQTPSTEPWGSPPVVSEFIPTYITYSLICHCVIACCCQAYYTLCLVSASGWALPNYETGKVCFFWLKDYVNSWSFSASAFCCSCYHKMAILIKLHILASSLLQIDIRMNKIYTQQTSFSFFA